jgi:dihydrolipoamide dehydrogenase
MMASYDTIVIGAGPGGYVAAIRAAQLGQKTAVVERDKAGGRCLNYACIPAKTVLHTAQVYSEVAESGPELGVKATNVGIDWKAVQERRAKVSKTLEDGVAMLTKKNKIDFLAGEASLEGGGKVKVGKDTHEAKTIVLATGSVAMPIPGIDFSERVIDTWGAWSLEKMPKALVVAGAGASGSEIASAYARMGVEVTLVEMLDQLLPAEDKEMSRVVERQFKKDGIQVMLGTKVEGVTEQKTGVKVQAGGKELKADYLAIAGGRRPDTDPLNLEAAGVKVEENGKIAIDEFQKTSADGIYAIGDLVRGPALAHKASEEGVVAVEHAAGQQTHPVDMNLVPGATFCHPQVASVGLTEEQAKEAGHKVKVGKFKLGGAGASVVYDDRAGLVKIVGEETYGEILGAHIVGNIACDMISEIVNVMALEGGYPELARIIHPHPTMSEAILDGARAVDGWATHV